MIFPPLAAWAGHTDVSREMAKSLTAALSQHGVKHETAADAMGLGIEDFSKQVNGLKPLNLWRLSYLPCEVYLTYLQLEARRFAAELVTSEDRAFVVGFARAGHRRMAAMFPQWFDEERQVG
jgi:hypothetical protein